MSGLLIGMCAERRIFLGEFRQRLTQLALSGLCLRLNRQLYDRFREFHALKNHRMLFRADRVAGCRELEPDRRGDVTAVDLLELRSLVRVHLKDASDPLLLVLGRVQNIGSGITCS